MLNADGVCSGDIFLVAGQSNALAPARSPTTATSYVWVRSFGTNSTIISECQSDTSWGIADGGGSVHHSQIGVWPYRFGKIIADSTGIPVGIINGARDGSRIISNLPPTNHTDLNSIYGKMLYRASKAHITAAVKALFWYQGEGDADSATFLYASRFNQLYNAWKQDYPDLSKIILLQIRPGFLTG